MIYRRYYVESGPCKNCGQLVFSSGEFREKWDDNGLVTTAWESAIHVVQIMPGSICDTPDKPGATAACTKNWRSV